MKHCTDKDYFEEWLDYDRETGEFTWKKPPAKGVKAGETAGWCNKQGYRVLGLKNKDFRLHRIAWLLEHGEWPNGELDHINRIKGDNRIENLRLATGSQNSMNRSKRNDNTSGYKGVSWHRNRNKWQALIGKNNKLKHLGYFETMEDAVNAYTRASAAMFGEYCCNEA